MPAQRPLRFCIPIPDRPLGGMYTFLRIFRRYLADHGCAVTSEVADEYDVLFVNSFIVPHDVLRRAKKRLPSLRVVQRVDGSARDYGRMGDADARQAQVNTLADLTIFQSYYGKYATRAKYSVISQDGPVIHNPVDTQVFRPDGQAMSFPGRLKVCHVTFSTNPHKGVESLYEVAKRNTDVQFILAGKYVAPPCLSNVHLVGQLDREVVPMALRGCDIYATFSENETCPNTVLEALASGLQVLYKDSGGIHELVGRCGATVDVENFGTRLRAVLDQREELARAARRRAMTLFAPEVVLPKYLRAIEDCRRRSLMRARDLVRLRVQGYPVLRSPLSFSLPSLLARFGSLRTPGRQTDE